MNEKEANRHFPLWTVQFEEYVYGKDSGNPWDDPENDIRKKGRIKYFSQQSLTSGLQEEYSELFGSFNYAFHKAYMTLSKLREVMPPKENTVMFQYQDKMFAFQHWFNDQKCVYGEAIDDYIDEYEDDIGVKVDIVQSYVSFYDKDCLVVKNGNLYMNGKMLISKLELLLEYGIEKYQVEMMYPNDVKKKIEELFPQAKNYWSWCAGGVLNDH